MLDGSYAIQRPFVLVTKDGTALSAAAQAFFDFATSKARRLPAFSKCGRRTYRQVKPQHRGGRSHLTCGGLRSRGFPVGSGKAELYEAGQPGKSLRSAGPKAMEQAIHLIFLLCGIVAVGFVLLHQRVSGDLRPAGHPGDRTDQIPLRQGVGAYQRHHRPAIRHPALHPHLCLRHGGSASLLGVPVGLMTAIFLAKVAPPKAGGGDPHGGGAAGGHPVGGVRPGGHDRAGARHPECLRSWPPAPACWRPFMVLAVMILPSIINVSRDGPAGRAQGV